MAALSPDGIVFVIPCIAYAVISSISSYLFATPAIKLNAHINFGWNALLLYDLCRFGNWKLKTFWFCVVVSVLFGNTDL